MSDFSFDITERRTDPITFRLGGNMLLEPAREAKGIEGQEGYEPAQPERRGPDDHEYVFNPPKSAVMMMPLFENSDDGDGTELTRATFDWLSEGLSESDNQRLIARLKDKNDGLDVDHLSDIIKKFSERVAGRPTS